MTNNFTTVTSDPLASLRAWEPVAQPAWYRDASGTMRNTEGVAQIVFRDDTGAALGTIGANAQLVSNNTKVQLWDRLAAAGIIRDMRCGEFAKGARVWLQGAAAQNRAEILPGHEVRHNLSLLDAYNGSLSLSLVDSAINIVCQNTFSLVARSNAGTKLRHTGSIHSRFEALCRAIESSGKRFAASVEAYQELAAKPARFADLKEMLDRFFPLPTRDNAGDSTVTERRVAAVQATRNRIAWAHEAAPGADPGSRFGLWQAATYYITHERGRDSSRFEQQLVGEGSRLRGQILDYLLN
jgi:phage/plasmid-like protein (TIGR03299 family)